MKTGVELICEERMRQVSEEGYNNDHDDDHHGCEIAMAAACYAKPPLHRRMKAAEIEMDAARGCSDPAMPYIVRTQIPTDWPWDPEFWKPSPDDRIRELVKAGALIAAEIDRLGRKK